MHHHFNYRRLKCVAGLVVLVLGTLGCSVQSEYRLAHVARSEVPPAQDTSSVFVEKPPIVAGEHCRTQSSLPFFWRIDMNKPVEEAFAKVPHAIGLKNVIVTQKVSFFIVRTKICMNMIGVPVYRDP